MTRTFVIVSLLSFSACVDAPSADESCDQTVEPRVAPAPWLVPTVRATAVGEIATVRVADGRIVHSQTFELFDIATETALPPRTLTCTLSGCQGLNCKREGCAIQQPREPGGQPYCSGATCTNPIGGSCSQVDCAQSWSQQF